MNKRFIAVAVLVQTSGVAMAQSAVTMYGNVDFGVLARNHAPAGGTPMKVASGGMAPNIVGFRGSEDLGHGLSAFFNVEGDFSSDTANSNLRLFRRQFNVGLSKSKLGKVAVGTQYSPAILAYGTTDPRGLRENFSALHAWVSNSGLLTVGGNTNSDAGVFLRNAVSYSYTQGALGIGAAYSVPEDQGAVYSFGTTYDGIVLLSFAYQSTNKPKTSEQISRLHAVGTGYTMGAFTYKLNYLRGMNKNVDLLETSDVGVMGVGVEWKMSAHNTVMAAVYSGKDKNNRSDKTTTLIVSDEYALSKRTTLYGTMGFASTEAGATLLTTVVAGGSVANTNTHLLNVGIKHSF